jgi:hypothetical protein
MRELLTAAMGALVSGVLGTWLLPIWREARRIGPHSIDLPTYCGRRSLNRLIFRFFQWVYWGEVPLIKAPIQLLEDRLKRPQTAASGMIVKSEGAIYRFDPMPVFQSMLNKIPLICMAVCGIFVVWVFSVSLLTSVITLSHPIDLLESAFKFLMLFFAVSMGVTFLLTPFSETELVILVQDRAIRIRWPSSPPILALPVWRIASDVDESFTLKRLFGSITLIEVCDNGVWRPACRPRWISFKLSRLVEQDKDWKGAFAKFQALLTRDIETENASAANAIG